jgi:CRP/FNR family cyclic AMP-dependent transcriptional regulator
MVGIKKLEKGELLLQEGDSSSSMYWLQTGQMRLFKKKGTGFIELGVIHSGELVGEMSFLDNEPRSASIEALTKCELIEIPRGKFDEVMTSLPSWLHSLVQTLVKRLRSTNNRLREIESASTVYVKDAEGNTQKQHEFISTNEVLRLSSALVFCASRRAEQSPDRSVKIKSTWMHTTAGSIMNVPEAKITAFIDVLADAGVLRVEGEKDLKFIVISSPDFLDRFTIWLNEENLKPVEKRLPLSEKGMIICDMIYQFGNLQAFTGKESVMIDVSAIYMAASEALSTKLPFEMSSWPELVACGFAGELKAGDGGIKSAELMLTRFRGYYPYLNLRQRFTDLNETKRP